MAPLRSLKFRIALTIFLLEGIMMAAVLWQTLGTLTESVRSQLDAQEQAALELLARVSRTALLTQEFGELRFYYVQAQQDPHIARVLLADPQGRVVASAEGQDLGTRLPDMHGSAEQRWRMQSIANVSGPLGTLAVQFSTAELARAESRARNLGLLIAAIGMSGIAVFGLAIGHLLTRRLGRLAHAARRVSEGDMAVRTRLTGQDEIAAVGQAFDTMAERVQADRIALQQANTELEARVHARTAELEAANKELESFAYSVSHDLRAPLRGIDGFSQALLEDYGDRLDKTGQDYLHRVRSGVQRMGALIDDLLKLSRLSRTTPEPKQVDLSALASDIAGHLREAAPEHNVEIGIQPGLSAYGDPGLLRAALENLLNNAWKYSAKNPRPHIEFGARQQEGETVYFVRDNGAGFDMAHAGKLFGAFQRLHHRDEFEGTGIGLATVRRIVHRHGGRIWAEAAPGQGATFYFTLGSEGAGR